MMMSRKYSKALLLGALAALPPAIIFVAVRASDRSADCWRPFAHVKSAHAGIRA
jgi:hypothetical protein